MSELSKATAPLRALKQQQPSRFWAKIQRTFWGLGLAALGIVGLARFGFPAYLGVVLAFVGAIVASGEIVLAPLKAALGLGKDVLRTLKGQNGQA